MDFSHVDWIGIYKLARLGLMASVLLGIALYLVRRPELELPAQRMLEDDDA